MISVVYLKWLKGNHHPLNEFASSSLSLNSTLATMITYSIPITSISTYTANTKPSTPTSPFQKSLAQTLQQHHSLLNTKHSTLTSRCLQYISHILLHSGVHLFHSLFILLIWTTSTIHSYRSKHSHNIHKHIPITSISSTQQTQPSQSTTHKNNTSHSPVVEPFQTLFLSRTLPNTNSHSHSSTKSTTHSTLTSGCLQYISHILLHSGVHLFHSLFILLIWTTFTSHPYCPEHSHNIHHSLLYQPQQTTQHLTNIRHITISLHNHIPFHISFAQPLHSLLCPHMPPLAPRMGRTLIRGSFSLFEHPHNHLQHILWTMDRWFSTKMKGEIGYRFRTNDSPNLVLMSVKEELVNVKHDQHESKPMNSLSSFPPLFYNLSFVTSVGTNHPPFQKSLAQTLQQHHSLFNTKHSTLTSLTSLTSRCLQYISHILPHSGVHLFHSLFILLIWTIYTSPPYCPEHPYNIHYPFSITSISSTQPNPTISQATTHNTTPLKLFSFHAPCPTPNIHSHSPTNSTTQSTLTSRYTTLLLPLYGVHLFHSLVILLIWTTITFHSYCPKLSHNILHPLLYLLQQTTQHLSTFTITSRFTYL